MPLPKVPIQSRPSRVFGERGDVAIGEAFFDAGARVAEGPGARIPLGESAGLGADPQTAAAILEQRDDVVVRQRTRFGDVAAIAGEGFSGGVEPGEAADHADPQPSLVVDEQRLHAVVGQRRAAAGLLAIGAPSSAARIEAAEARIRADPHHAIGRLGQCAYAKRLARRQSSAGSATRVTPKFGAETRSRPRRAADQRVAAAQMHDAEDGIVGERLRISAG